MMSTVIQSRETREWRKSMMVEPDEGTMEGIRRRRDVGTRESSDDDENRCVDRARVSRMMYSKMTE